MCLFGDVGLYSTTSLQMRGSICLRGVSPLWRLRVTVVCFRRWAINSLSNSKRRGARTLPGFQQMSENSEMVAANQTKILPSTPKFLHYKKSCDELISYKLPKTFQPPTPKETKNTTSVWRCQLILIAAFSYKKNRWPQRTPVKITKNTKRPGGELTCKKWGEW